MENQTQIPVNQSIGEPAVQAEQQPQKNNFLVILLSILLIISLSIAGFFAFQTQKLVKELTTLKSIEKVTTEVASLPTTDPTTDWKIYTDEMNRFSFKYPIDVDIKNENGRLSMILPDFDYPVSIVSDGPHNWGEGMAKEQIDRIYMKQFQYPNEPDKKMFPDTDVQFVIEFLKQDDKNKATVALDRIDQIVSTFKFIN